jgi:hypothetical protein
MTLWGAARVLLIRWYMTLPGLLLALAAGAIVFALVPPVYTSTGVAILVRAKQPGINPPNPLLSFDASLSTTASIVIQGLNSPETASMVEVDPDDSYTVSNTGDGVPPGDPSARPFIYVRAQSRSSDSSVQVVQRVLDMANQDLIDRQREMRLLPRNFIQIDQVVDATPPKRIRGSQLGASLATVALFGVLVIAFVLLREDILARRRRRSKSTEVEPREQLPIWATASATRWPDSRDAAIKTSGPHSVNSMLPAVSRSGLDGMDGHH